MADADRKNLYEKKTLLTPQMTSNICHNSFLCIFCLVQCLVCTLDTVQDFSSKLDLKPHIHLLEKSIFFTKSCHRQTYQNVEQSRKKLGTFLENNSKKYFDKSCLPSLIFLTIKFNAEKMTEFCDL